MLAGLIGTCSSPPSILEQVLETGVLRVVTRDSPTAYTITPDGPSGPEYDLVKEFADKLGVELVIETVGSVSEIMPKLLSGDAHMAAAGLSITDSRREYLNFGHPYESVDVHLIYKLGDGKPRSVEDILDRTIEIAAGSSHVDLLAALQTTYPELSWTENADLEFAELLTKVAVDEVDLTVADSLDFNIQRHFYPDLRVALDLKVDDPIAWAFPKGVADSLLARADRFLIGMERNGYLAQVHDRYYGHTNQFDYVGTRNFIRHFESRLPRYRAMFEQAAEEWGIDWRLLAAIGYQESHWRANAVSPTGVRGIMMLTQATADYVGIEDRTNPESSIFGGAQYFLADDRADCRQRPRARPDLDGHGSVQRRFLPFERRHDDHRVAGRRPKHLDRCQKSAAPEGATQMVFARTLRLRARLGTGAVRRQCPPLLQHPAMADSR